MPARSTERRVVEHAAELECLFEKTILLIVYTKREFDDVGRSSRSHMAMLLLVPKMGTPCPLFEKRGLRRTVSINKVVVHGYRVRRQKIEAYRIEGMRMRIFFGIREA